MKNKITALLIAIVISVTTYAAAVWVGSQYLETFQNGIMFGNFQILKVSNGVPEFEDASGNEKRLDDADKDIFFQEDFEGAAVSFTCDANITAADDTGLMGSDTSKSFTQSTGAQDEICYSANIPFAGAQEGKLCLVSSGSTNWDLKVYDVTNSSYLGTAPLRGESNQDCVWFEGVDTTANIRYELVVRIEENTDELIIDNVKAKYFPFETGDIYASSESADYTPATQGLGTPTITYAKWRQEGEYAVLNLKITAGTVTANELQIGLPDGLVADSEYSLDYLGTLEINAVNSNHFSVLATGGDAFLNVGFRGGGAANLFTAVNANAFMSNGDVITLSDIRVKIAGWTNTKKSVTVKNTTASDIASENEFSARVDNNGSSCTVVTENIDFINDSSCTRNGTGDCTCSFNSGIFSVIPSGQTVAVDTNTRHATFQSLSTTSFRVFSVNEAGAAIDTDFLVSFSKQGTDFVKERDRVYTFAADSLTGNNLTLSGSDGRGITSVTESIPFDGSGIGWTSGADGSTGTTGNYYEVQKNSSKVVISIAVQYSSDLSNRIRLNLNGSFYRYIGTQNPSNVSYTTASYISTRGEFSAGDKLSFHLNDSATLLNSTNSHYLNISEEYGDRGTFVGQWGYESCYVKDVKSSGTEGGTATSGSWLQRDLNTIGGDCSFLSLSSNAFTLDKGAYDIDCVAILNATVNNGQHRLRNTTDSTTEVVSMSQRGGAGDDNISSLLGGRVVATDSKTYELQYQVQTTRATDGLGPATSFGESEVYAQCKITKVR